MHQGARSKLHRFCPLIIGLLISACSAPQRVQLQAPSPRAAPEQRIAAFVALRPIGRIEETQQRGNHQYVDTMLELGDHRVITDPRDLLVVVPANSATAKSIERYKTHHKRQRMWTWIGRGLLVSSLSLLVGGYAMDKSRPMMWGAGVAALGGLTSVVFRFREIVQSQREEEVTYRLYEKDLMRHLGLKLQYNGPRVRQRKKPPQSPIAARVHANTIRENALQGYATRPSTLEWKR